MVPPYKQGICYTFAQNLEFSINPYNFNVYTSSFKIPISFFNRCFQSSNTLTSIHTCILSSVFERTLKISMEQMCQCFLKLY